MTVILLNVPPNLVQCAVSADTSPPVKVGIVCKPNWCLAKMIRRFPKQSNELNEKYDDVMYMISHPPFYLRFINFFDFNFLIAIKNNKSVHQMARIGTWLVPRKHIYASVHDNIWELKLQTNFLRHGKQMATGARNHKGRIYGPQNWYNQLNPFWNSVQGCRLCREDRITDDFPIQINA